MLTLPPLNRLERVAYIVTDVVLPEYMYILITWGKSLYTCTLSLKAIVITIINRILLR